jgi:enoyl-CoA hydratase/carnithine racemase
MLAVCEHGIGKLALREMLWTGKRYPGPDAVAVGFARAAHPGPELIPKSVELATFMAGRKQPAFMVTKRRWAHDVVRVIDERDAAAVAEFQFPR